jgi:toxin ParE1/3/4
VRMRWTPEAEQDRADIVEYIAADNPRAALRMDELFSSAAARLADHPRMDEPARSAARAS